MSQDRKRNYAKFNHLYKLYCPHNTLRFVCFYCGLPAGTVDHVPPLNAVDKLRESHERINYLKVPACHSCNSLGSDESHTNLYDRQAFIKQKIRTRYKKYLKFPDWEDDEIAELGYRLRQTVIALMEMKYLVVYRLEYGDAKSYKLSKSGYRNFDPHKVMQYAHADRWDETQKKVESAKVTLDDVSKYLSRKSTEKASKYSMPEAMATVRRLKLKGSTDYFAWRRNNTNNPLRLKLPPNPPQLFQETWSGWQDFIGPQYENKNKSSKISAKDYVSYAEAKNIVQRVGVSNSTDYGRVRSEQDGLQDLIPSAPKNYYGDAWEGWPVFLGDSYRNKKQELKKSGNKYLSYSRAAKLLREHGVQNSSAYSEFRKSKPNLKPKLPPSPPKAYKDSWVSWQEFLGDCYVNRNQRGIVVKKT